MVGLGLPVFTVIKYFFNYFWYLLFLFCRWPLLIDTSPQSSTFLRYRDTNFMNALNPNHMQPEVIRMSLLGALRSVK